MPRDSKLKRIWKGAFLPGWPVGPGMPYFLRAVEEHASDALTSLRRDVFSQYQSYRAKHPSAAASREFHND
jgi:hypothetical protein